MDYLKKYFKPKSLTWWSGTILATLQAVRAFGVEIPKEVDAAVIAMFGIGIRGAIDGKKD